MDVSVLSKDGKRSLRSAARASVLGNGLLERTRSTSLALLGFTAAIGLAMVALALNQGWPLIAGAPIPGLGGGHQAVGDAAVAARAKAQSGAHAIAGAPRPGGPAASGAKSRPHRSGTAALAGSTAPQSADLVGAHPTDGNPPADPIPSPAPAQEPSPAAVPAASPVVSSPGPVAQTTPDPQTSGSTEGPEVAPPPAEPPPTEDETPEESDDGSSHAPSWSHGGGHGYGHGHW
jgi:hypothetical protein